MTKRIQILPSSRVDAKSWDHCVNSSTNGFIYSRKQYLDLVCDQWHALVADDYSLIMPIPWRRKFGIRYAYTPAFCQQLGITGMNGQEYMQSIYEALYRFVRYGDIHFNFGNDYVKAQAAVSVKTNFVIDLSKDIHTIRSSYRNDLKENIHKAVAENIQYTGTDIKTAIGYFIQQYGERIHTISKNDFIRFSTLCESLYSEGDCFVRMASSTGGEPLAVALFLKDRRRIYNILNTTLPAGKKKSANHFLLDQVLAEFSNSPLLFDFEGSALPGVKQFYEGFGPVNQPYYHYHFNQLPWLLRLWKR